MENLYVLLDCTFYKLWLLPQYTYLLLLVLFQILFCNILFCSEALQWTCLSFTHSLTLFVFRGVCRCTYLSTTLLQYGQFVPSNILFFYLIYFLQELFTSLQLLKESASSLIKITNINKKKIVFFMLFTLLKWLFFADCSLWSAYIKTCPRSLVHFYIASCNTLAKRAVVNFFK